MNRVARLLGAATLLGLAAAPTMAHAASRSAHHATARPSAHATTRHAAGRGTKGAAITTAPLPVAVYEGRRLVASGQSLTKAIGKVQSKVPFTIGTAHYIPKGYTATQLAVTPAQRDVSRGWSTLSYTQVGRKGVVVASANGFVIDQSSSAIPVVGGTHVATVVAGALTTTLHEFKTAGHDILILTWVDGAGHGYDIVTDAAISHLSPATLGRIAASVR